MADEDKIKKDMTIGEVVVKFPETIPIMMRNGLHCVGCHVAAYETVEQGAAAHGMDEKQIETMVKDMNEAIKEVEDEEEK